MKISLVIKSYYPSLTRSERKVADFVLNNESEFVNMSLADIAKKTDTGEATVMRFCKRMGCEKLINFKLMIAKETEQGSEVKADNPKDALAEEMIQVIRDTHDMLDMKYVQKAVDLIDKAQHLFFYGVGASGLTALEAEGNFLRIGKYAKAFTDSHFQAMNSSVIEKGDVIVAFSLTGNTKDVYDSCLIAKNGGAKVIAVTNYIESGIAKIADVVLLTAAKEHIMKGGTLAGTYSQLFVVDMLRGEFARRHQAKVKELREKTAASIIGKSL